MMPWADVVRLLGADVRASVHGNPHLNKQIIEVTTLMRVADNKHSFETLFQKAFPKKGAQLRLELRFPDEPQDENPDESE